MVKQHSRTAIISAMCAIFAVVSQAMGERLLIIMALACFLAIMVFAKDEYLIPLFLFFMPFSTILKLSPESISFSSIAIILVFVIRLLVNFDKPFDPRLITSFVGIAAITIVALFLNDYGISLGYLMFMGMLIAFPLFLTWTKDKVSFETCIYFYSLGIILATALAWFFDDNANLIEYIRVLEEKEVVTRHCGFYGDPNFYSAQVVTAIGGQLLIIKNRKENFWVNILAIVALTVCGLTSVSKSYILCLLLLGATWVLSLRKKESRRYFKIFIAVFFVLTLAMISIGLFSDILDQYLLRFASGGDLSALTTNRTTIWKAYIKFFLANPTDLLVGQGYTNVLVAGVQKSCHNTIMQCVYQFGLIGCIFVVSWLNSVISSLEPRKARRMDVIVLLVACFSMWMGIDLVFFDDFFLTIVLFALGLSYIQSSKEQDSTLC